MKIFNKKIFNILFLVIIVLMPLQTRYFLITQKINNNFFEYGSLSLYLLDILIVLFIIYGTIFSIKNKTKINKKAKIFLLLLFLFNASIFSSIMFSADKTVAIFHFIKILMLSFFSFIVFINRIEKEWFINSFIISSSIQGFVAIYQFIMQSVLANKYIGIAEQQAFNLGTYVIEGSFGRILKSYGFFPHPNMLGIFLIIGLFFIMLQITKHKKDESQLEMNRIDFKMIYFIYVFGINFIGLIFTFSRTSIAIFGLMFLIFSIYQLYLYKKFPERKLRYNFNIFIILIFIIFSTCLPSTDLLASRVDSGNRLVEISTNDRISQIQDFKNIITKKYLTGVGIGNYTIYKHLNNEQLNVWDLQPIHNIYLLIFIECGIFGILTFLAIIIFKLGIAKNIETTVPFIIMLLFGIVDHFLITLSFGLIIFFIFLGLNDTEKI